MKDSAGSDCRMHERKGPEKGPLDMAKDFQKEGLVSSVVGNVPTNNKDSSTHKIPFAWRNGPKSQVELGQSKIKDVSSSPSV